MKMPELKTIDHPMELDPPLDEEVEDFVYGIMSGARGNFEEFDECKPFFFGLDEDGQVVPHIIQEITPESKGKMFQWMHRQRTIYRACIFLNEMWISHPTKMEQVMHPDGENLTPPSERPDRGEGVMLNLWNGDRRITLIADITRNPDKLGPWRVLEDTSNPENGVEACGRMIGVPPKKSNPERN